MSTRRVALLAGSLLVLAGCSRGTGERTDHRSATGKPVLAPFLADNLAPPSTPVPEPTPPPPPVPTPAPASKECHPLYDPDTLPTYHLEIAPAVWQALVEDFAADRDVYRPAVFRFEGYEYPNAMVSYRGNNSRCGDKLQLAIAFHKGADPDGRFQGLRRLDLDHGGCRVLHERIAYELAREAGVDAPCANNVRVFVNGAYYGLFANLEHVNREFLTRNFELPEGNLYKAGRRKNNEDDPDTSDFKDYKNATDLASVDEIVDLDQAVRMWAVEALLPAADNFWYFGRNYYLYNHPGRGFVFLPNDYDHAVPLGWSWNWHPMLPLEHPTNIVLADPSWRARFLEELAAAHARFRPEWHEARLDRYWDQTWEHIAADPHMSGELDDDEIEDLKALFRQRARLIADFLVTEGYSSDAGE